MKVTVNVRCDQGHVTAVSVFRPEFNDGVLVHGLCGSSADFCDVCDGPVEFVPDSVEIS